MLYENLPKRVFNSPLIEYANFTNKHHVNLIRLNKPYSNGDCYAVLNTCKLSAYPSRMLKNLKNAKEYFNFTIASVAKFEELISTGITGN